MALNWLMPRSCFSGSPSSAIMTPVILTCNVHINSMHKGHNSERPNSLWVQGSTRIGLQQALEHQARSSPTLGALCCAFPFPITLCAPPAS